MKASNCPGCNNEPVFEKVSAAGTIIKCPIQRCSYWVLIAAKTKKRAIEVWNEAAKLKVKKNVR